MKKSKVFLNKTSDNQIRPEKNLLLSYQKLMEKPNFLV